MGAQLALDLGRAGYAVGLIDASPRGLAHAAEQLRDEGWPYVAVEADVADEDMVRTAFSRVNDGLGPPWALLATAGVLSGQFLVDMEAAHFSRVLGVNLYGTLYSNREAARYMIANGGGRIVNWSSVAASRASAGYSAYCASKSAVESLTRCFAVELGGYGITVNAIAPGSTDTAMVGYLDDAARNATILRIPVQRWGTPADMSAAASFLITDAASFISGAVLPVDGGLLASTGGEVNLAASEQRITIEHAYQVARRID